MQSLNEANIKPGDLKSTLTVHDTLNSKLWDGNALRVDVQVALLKAAKAFVEFIDLPGLEVEDVILTGSNASFNYTEFSDLDVHIIVSYDGTPFSDLAENFFTTKKSLWNETHEIRIKGYAVEMYVEDTAQPVKALGVYSLLNSEWMKKPTLDGKPEWDDRAVAAKVDHLANKIDDLLQNHPDDKDKIDRAIDRIRAMRKSGLADGGEFSTENLAFKGLRNLGYMDRLYAARMDAEDRSLSLEGVDTP
jgi:hypothetical protein